MELLAYFKEAQELEVGRNIMEVALDVLARMLPDEEAQRRIKNESEIQAGAYHFLSDDGRPILGSGGHRHFLACRIIDAVEKQTCETVCFVGPDDTGLITDWYLREKPKRSTLAIPETKAASTVEKKLKAGVETQEKLFPPETRF